MKKTGWTAFVGAVLLAASSVFLLWHFRVQPLSSLPEKRVYKATSFFCSRFATDPVGGRLIFVELVYEENTPYPLVRVNKEVMPMREAQERVQKIFAVRAARIVYVVDAAYADQSNPSELIKMVERLEVINVVCVIDPKNPPSWYPPREIVYPVARR